MSFLKGNYELKKGVDAAKEKEKGKGAKSTEEFEKFARVRLGGSIAFVMKKNTFVWEGDDKKEDPDKKK